MTRRHKIFAGVATAILLVLIALVVIIATFDWNRLKPTINEHVSQTLQRPFAIRGDLGVDWQRQDDADGFRAWVPWPHIHAEDLVLGNPPDIAASKGTDDNMVTLARADASISPLALLNKHLVIPRITLTQPNAELIRLADGSNNWTFNLASSDDESANDTGGSGWSVDINDIVFDRGRVHYLDAKLDADVEATIDPLGKPVPYTEIVGRHQDKGTPAVGQGQPADYVFGWQAKGRYKGEPLEGKGKIGGMLSLKDGEKPFPLQADVSSGSSRVVVAGTLNAPLKLGGLDLRLRFSGQSLGNLYGLTGIVLPDTPPYSTDGHLIARLHEPGGAVFEYDDFNGKIGNSDLHGHLRYVASQPRPRLTGELTSNQLRFADLAPLIGADTNKQKAARGEETRQPADKALPVAEFKTERWNSMDADVKFTAKRIEHSASLPLSDLYTHVTLDNGELLLDPLRFGVAGGHLNTTLRLDGRRSPMPARIDLHARRFQLKQLIPTTGDMRDALGELNGDATLSGTGNSVAALLGSSNGDVKVLVDNGVISRNLMELAGLNVGNYLVGKLFGDEEVRINCAAADLHFDDGLVRPRIFVFDTENAVIKVDGAVDLGSEKMDLTIDPESKGFRIFTLRSPLYVSGTFKNPAPGVKAAPLIARGAAAVALGTVAAPAAALLALVSPSEGEGNQCGPILREMQEQNQ